MTQDQSPAFDVEPLLAWYDAHRRSLPWRASAGKRMPPYKVWLSEIMLQQTTVATVTPRFETFLDRWPDIHALADAPLEDVLAEWAGLGYYARARNLHACAIVVSGDLGGEFPKTPEALAALPGIGAYTAAAIAAIAFDHPVVPVDGNIERVTARLFALDDPLPKGKARIAGEAQRLVHMRRSGDVAQALMDLGSSICRPRNPDCLLCPLTGNCIARKEGNPEALPVKAAKKQRPQRFGRAYCLFSEDGTVLLRRRPPKGLLGGMSELPGSDWIEGSAPPIDPPLEADWRECEGTVRHVFTHFALDLTVHAATSTRINPPEGYWWQPLDKIDEAGLPTVMAKALKAAIKG